MVFIAEIGIVVVAYLFQANAYEQLYQVRWAVSVVVAVAAVAAVAVVVVVDWRRDGAPLLYSRLWRLAIVGWFSLSLFAPPPPPFFFCKSGLEGP